MDYKLGVDLPGEKRGLIPNAQFYDKAYKGSWNGLTVISISIGQGEVLLTPLQIANLGATIANRGYYYVPHVVRKVQGEPLDTAFTRRHFTKADRKAYDYVVQGMRSVRLWPVTISWPVEKRVQLRTEAMTTRCSWVLHRWTIRR